MGYTEKHLINFLKPFSIHTFKQDPTLLVSLNLWQKKGYSVLLPLAFSLRLLIITIHDIHTEH